ncbi:hypothetical protein QYF61_027044 [Mycteria americana]|uniref:Integrase catalytic domain-containing protein n=1 Tax=Mycteria americana TaxID=33587 RepID=A0AAN7RSY6_MYCAM|nr:hypothetical protein QYF61_027044 [Mycteria americana]
MGRPGRSIISHSNKPAKASAMCLQWWKQPPRGWKHILCPMPLPRTLSWALKSKSCGNMAPQKELSQTMGLISETTSDTWAKEHGTEWVYHIPYHAPASGKIKRYNGLLKTALRAMGGGTSKHWDTHLAKATWLVSTRGSANRAGPAQSKLLHTVEGDKVPVVHIKSMLGKTVWVIPALGKGKPIRGIAFAQGPGCTWWVMREGGEFRWVPQGDLILDKQCSRMQEWRILKSRIKYKLTELTLPMAEMQQLLNKRNT